jgi:cell wall-associated NlpC family hydrolase
MLNDMRRSLFFRVSLGLATSMFAAACASTGGAVPRPFPVPGNSRNPGNQPAGQVETPASQAPLPAVDEYALVGTALALRGTPYRNGGTDPNGFDCSGFTQYVFAQHGLALPREVRDQFEQGKSIKSGELAAGDLLFFTTVAPGPTHVGISIGGDQFVHAPSSTGVVRVERFSTGYWSTRYLGARRVK